MMVQAPAKKQKSAELDAALLKLRSETEPQPFDFGKLRAETEPKTTGLAEAASQYAPRWSVPSGLQPGDVAPETMLKSMGSSVAAGAVGTAGAGLEGLGLAADWLEKKLPDAMQSEGSPFREAGSAMQKYAGSIGAESRQQVQAKGGATKFFGSTVPEALGSSATFGAGALVTGGLGGAAMGTTSIAIAGAAAGASQGYNDAIAHGASEEDAWTSALINAGAGATEAVPLGGIVGRLLKRMPRATSEIIKTAIKEGGEELIQEASQQTIGNLTAKYWVGYEEDRDLLQGVVEQGGAGALTGFLMSLLGGGAGMAFSPQVGAAVAPDETGLAAAGAVEPVAPAAPAFDQLAPNIPPEVVPAPEPAVKPSGQPEPVAPELAIAPLTAPEPAIKPPEPKVEPTPEPKAAETEPKAPTPEPEAPTGDLSDLTGIDNKAVDERRIAMGMEPATPGETVEWENVVRDAKAKIDADPTAAARLTKELTDKPRTISLEEVALLEVEAVRLSNERDAARIAQDEAVRTGHGLEDAQARVAAAQDAYFKTDEAATLAGTKQAQAFGFRAVRLKRDYSLAEMERSIRDAKGGESLTAEESKQVQDLHDKITATEKAFQDYVASAETRAAVQAVEIEALSRKTKRTFPARRPIQEFISARATEARARIKERGTRAMAGIDPFEVADYAIIGAEHIAKGLADFTVWSKAMLHEFGEKLKPHLEDIYRKAVDLHATAAKDRGRLQALKTRTQNTIDSLKAKIESEDFSKPTPRAALVLDETAIGLKAKNETLKVEFARLRRKHELAQRTRGQKIRDSLQEVLNLPRAIWSSYDVSAVFRQGAVLTLGTDPRVTAGQVAKMFRALASQEYARKVDTELRSRPGYEFGRASKLELTSLDADIGPQEEAIRSRLSDKIPGIPASNRAFITFLNLQRAEAFDAMVRGLPGTPTLEDGRALAHFVNVATGRGEAKALASAMQPLGRVLWSPRLLLSRIQILSGEPLYRAPPQARKIMAKQYGKTLLGLSAVYGLAALAGADLEDDPRSSNFGKVKVGSTTFDPLAGMSQITVLVSRLWTGEKTTLAGKVVPIRGDVKYGGDTSADVIARFLRSKLTPVLGSAIDVVSGEDVVGQPVTLASEAKTALVPLSFGDIYDAIRVEGVAKGVALSILGLFGMGLQTIPEKNKKN